jgi:hypothetical protein
MRPGARLGILAAALAGLLGALAAPAAANVSVLVYGMVPSGSQAGGHPDLQIGFSLKNGSLQNLEEGTNTPCDCQNARFVTVHAPQGLVGNPHAAPQCNAVQFIGHGCPVDSQVGVIATGLSTTPHVPLPFVSPVYNVTPRAGEAGLLGFEVDGVSIFEVFSARTNSDYGLETKIVVPDAVPLSYADQILWGVPADSSHDPLRFLLGGFFAIGQTLCSENGVSATPSQLALTTPPHGPQFATRQCGQESAIGVPSNSSPEPFIEAPTSCGEALQSSIDMLAYDGGETYASYPFPPATGCDQLSFNPSLAARPSTADADAPSGLDVELTVPQFESPTVPSPSEIRGTEMVLPEGFSINSNAADGKSACTDREASFGTTNAAQCPEASKIGTLDIETALLPGPLPGYLYLGQPLPGNRYRVFLVADGFNVHVKLAGRAVLDPKTGQIRVIFEDLPETPFQKFSLHIFGSERGALATPTKCGTYGITTTFTPWDAVLGKQSSKTFFTIDSGPNGGPCPGTTRPFNPGFEAASAGNTAGAHSSFALRLTREDGDQFFSALNVKTPPGFAATLKGVPYCPEAAIQAAARGAYSGISEQSNPSCPAASQVGEIIGGAGAGSRPFYAPGRAYLAGPYKGAPLSLVVVVPAVSGPYDLGNIVVRNALYVDPESAQVSAVSDPLPQIVEGVPLRVRSILVKLNRPDFALNPTNCDPHAVNTKITGDEGATATPSAHFQVANCANLPFAPKLSLKLTGGTKRAGHPALKGTLKARAGDANISRLVVALPHSEFLDQSHIQTVCTRVQFAAKSCPAASIYGHASATTPLLDSPLSGPVYLRSSSNLLPDLVIALKGPPSQPIEVVVAGKVDTGPSGGIRTSFETVPDAQVSSFTLSMAGGKRGLLENSTDICKAPQRVSVKAEGQNGRRNSQSPALQADCKGKAKHKRGHRAKREGR